MRSDKAFVDAYAAALGDVDPAAEGLSAEDLRLMAGAELCLDFLARYAPDEDVAAMPFLLMGYPGLIGAPRPKDLDRALAAVRHLCGRFSPLSAWVDACARYGQIRETWRCHEIRDGRAARRGSASARILRVLEDALTGPAPWSEATVHVAGPGPASVRVSHGRKVLAYDVPPVSGDRQRVRRHELRRRSVNPPIALDWSDLAAAAERVDARERQADWPVDALPRLNLADRLRKVQLQVPGSDEAVPALVVDGATHLVGMLSSGKSTLVWALIFAMSLGGGGRRVAMIVSDTIQAAAVSARLRRHGVTATVLSSVRNRERHFGAIQWRHGLSADSRSLSSLGDLTQGFGMACTLDGFQRDPDVLAGEDAAVTWPEMHEKPCHRLYQAVARDDVDESRAPDVVEGNGLSCPLFSSCSAQSQQRDAVTAQVLVMTPQAFIHMTPDPWTTEQRLTLPELLQYAFDLVIMDEVDSVQKAFDDTFAPRSPIMGDDLDVYAPTIGARTAEAVRARSGHQFRRAANTRWQSNFHTLFRLIGFLYALLQREGDSIGRFYKHAPFTSAGILGELWRLRQVDTGAAAAPASSEDYETNFVDVLRVAAAIGQFSRASAVVDEHDEGRRDALGDVALEPLRVAGAWLRGLAQRVLTSDYYEELLPEVEDGLADQLSAFDARGLGGERRGDEAFSARSNAAALTLAVVTELVLAHYNWLIKAQPGVARDFDIDDGQLFSQASNLLRHYRTLLPANPAGGVFGLFYDEPPAERRHELGGRLTLVNHLGVGRHLLVHLHDLLAAEGQAGPHVLMLSGTSWAGGDRHAIDGASRQRVDLASPVYDVQVPVRGVLVQPAEELEAIQRSKFGLFDLRDKDGEQVAVSGLRPPERQRALASIGERLATPGDRGCLLEHQWLRLERQWGADALVDRRRALLVVNSYADAIAVGDAVVQALDRTHRASWTVCSLVPDRADDDGSTVAPMLARALPRSLVERFGLFEGPSVLVAPLSVIARGHNILNRQHPARAAISTIYFLHRPHPRPDDLGPAIAGLNRLAMRYYGAPKGDASVVEAGRALRRDAASHVRRALAMRQGYRALPPVFKAQFAWDMLTPLWQTIGRGIRGGSPVYVGFVDAKFAPRSFAGETDTPDTSVLVQALQQLRGAFQSSDCHEAAVARLLYEPFFSALTHTEGLKHA